ncbi:MAG: choice-of-anchor D domain-containing protein [Deltaproteobacteria bacterium]|nr:choice-of-anchor D domain-containing protein [Deltaproteobacteria bacterium]MCB9788316.1 choice-of-anchor D domain-containing protein [Deltaproteobacteria bacterium]
MIAARSPSRRAGPLLISALGLWLGSACSATVELPDRDASGGDSGGSDLATLDVETGGPNSAPGPAEIRIDPAVPTTLDTLRVAIESEAVDPDGGPEAVTYLATWFKDSAPTLHSGLEIPPQVTKRGETWRVEVRAFDGVAEGPVVAAEVTIINTPPTLDGVALEPTNANTKDLLVCTPGAREDADSDAISVSYAWTLDGQPIEGATTGAMQPPLQAGKHYACAVTPFDGQVQGETVHSNEVVPIDPEDISDLPFISFQPKSLDLGSVLPGATSERELEVFNIGVGTLELTGHEFTGDPYFTLVGDLPRTVEPGGSTTFTVRFATDQPGLKKGALFFESNAGNGSSVSVPLLGIGSSPCLQIQPTFIDFGGAYVGSQHERDIKLISCGTLPVTIESAALAAPASSPFKLDLSAGPGPMPWTLQGGESITVRVRYSPLTASPVAMDGTPVAETALVSFQPGGFAPLINIPVRGFASALGCPQAIIEVEEGHYVGPGTTLFMNGSKSFAPGGKPTIFSWSVTGPTGAPVLSVSPDSSSEAVTYGPVTTLGVYKVELKVFDEVEGQVIPGCSTAQWLVEVKKETPLVVELTWNTPGDPNQQDTGPGVGADLDLHMHDGHGTKPDYDGDGEPDGWFDADHDVYWFDTSPDWGVPGEADDPQLTIEDADGKGPERLEFPLPAKGERYTVGAHCYSSYGFGPSVATVRVWLFGTLIAKVSDVVLDTGQLWEVGYIDWPSGDFTQSFGADGGPLVTADYPNPFF